MGALIGLTLVPAVLYAGLLVYIHVGMDKDMNKKGGRNN